MAQGRVVPIDCDGIVDWNSFHDTMIEAFGFPGWYGRNMNAWVDLMTYLDEDQATTRVYVENIAIKRDKYSEQISRRIDK